MSLFVCSKSYKIQIKLKNCSSEILPPMVSVLWLDLCNILISFYARESVKRTSEHWSKKSIDKLLALFLLLSGQDEGSHNKGGSSRSSSRSELSSNYHYSLLKLSEAFWLSKMRLRIAVLQAVVVQWLASMTTNLAFRDRIPLKI